MVVAAGIGQGQGDSKITTQDKVTTQTCTTSQLAAPPHSTNPSTAPEGGLLAAVHPLEVVQRLDPGKLPGVGDSQRQVALAKGETVVDHHQI